MSDHVEGGAQLGVYGARGSAAASGSPFIKYGGNTTCFASVLRDGHRVLVDCGSGLSRLQAELLQSGDDHPFEATVFLTHFHWDHLQGLPLFAPLYEQSTRLHFVATPPDGMTIGEALDGAIRPPWFPVRFRDVPATVSFETIGDQPVRLGTFDVFGAPLPHPGGVTGYRFEHAGGALVIATDFEAVGETHGASLRSLADGADVLIHDAQYTPDEYRTSKGGWGHSTWEAAARAAIECGVARLILTSHDPSRTDEQVDALVAAARTIYPETDAAFEGQRIQF